MKTHCWIVSVAVLLVCWPPVAAASELPMGGAKISVPVPRGVRDDPAGVIAASGRLSVVVPEPNKVTPVSFPDTFADTPAPQVDPSSDGFAVEGEATASHCPGYPVATHLTAAGSGEPCCPHCGGSRCGHSRSHCGRGWWRGRVKPCLQCSHWGYADL
ncbi:MAG: hypothetical protein ACYSWU_22395, partial [Planctomycetota bacterium]